ncbi:DCC1-like thiol-disulfide oxidoreductase family protein [Protofrankia coriariae]|uniref:DCC1-like thiol-disulfide oxidoreductase family protein n=1 Tax=Protofrankia coriariae TaxID=1562887 RepID=UPI00069B70D0|nr:DCC1-like thiol-disulfide oxidoreductase family protein [Protofrankia coriariae]
MSQNRTSTGVGIRYSPGNIRYSPGKTGARPRPVFVWDGDCAFCQAAVALLTRHLSPVPDVQPWQAVDLRGLGLTERQAREAVWWVDTNGDVNGDVGNRTGCEADGKPDGTVDGTACSGAQAVATWLAISGQPWRLLGNLLRRRLPGRIAAAVYVRTCRNRHRLPVPTWHGLWLWVRGLWTGAPAGGCDPTGTPPR